MPSFSRGHKKIGGGDIRRQDQSLFIFINKKKSDKNYLLEYYIVFMMFIFRTLWMERFARNDRNGLYGTEPFGDGTKPFEKGTKPFENGMLLRCSSAFQCLFEEILSVC